ncbi:MAG: hypothetical protein KAJ07_11195 [Planctomycetes bacterium]|nr:hypothetical protein [Planctomycetota bacterium]
MNKEEIGLVIKYCEKATEGPWERSGSKPKTIYSTSKDTTVCMLAGETHNTDWQNYHFLMNARTDLPALAKQCLGLMQQLKEKVSEVETERGRNQWLSIKKANKQLQLERGRKRWLQLGQENEHLKEQIEDQRGTIEQEKARTSQVNALLAKTKEEFRLELELLNEQAELVKQQYQEELDKAKAKLGLLARPTVQKEAGFSDGLLSQLHLIELDLKQPGGWLFADEKQPAAKPEDKGKKKPKPLTNDQLLGELDDIQKSLKPARRRRSSKAGSDVQNAADDFAGTTGKSSKVSVK